MFEFRPLWPLRWYNFNKKKTAARHWPTKRLPEYVSTNFDICSSDSYHRIHQSSLLWSLAYNGCLTRAGPAGRGCRGPGSVWRNVDLCVENRLRSYSSFCTSPQLIVTRTDIWYWATAVFSITLLPEQLCNMLTPHCVDDQKTEAVPNLIWLGISTWPRVIEPQKVIQEVPLQCL